MAFNAPDIETFKADLDNRISAISKLKAESHATIKIQSLLNIVAYASASRFLEGTIKHIIYNCCKMRGDNEITLNTLTSELKRFNNPEFTLIKELFNNKLNFNIMQGKTSGRFTETDISFLNEIVRNRHKNVHASADPAEWYNSNVKDINDFQKEYIGLINIITYLDSIHFDSNATCFCD